MLRLDLLDGLLTRLAQIKKTINTIDKTQN